MEAGERRPRWLIVVSSYRRDLYQSLRQIYADNADVEIVLDRRSAVSGEDFRRQALTGREAEIWKDLNFLIARRLAEGWWREAPGVGPPEGTEHA